MEKSGPGGSDPADRKNAENLGVAREIQLHTPTLDQLADEYLRAVKGEKPAGDPDKLKKLMVIFAEAIIELAGSRVRGGHGEIDALIDAYNEFTRDWRPGPR